MMTLSDIMETRIYKIEPSKLTDVKKVLEREDMFNVKAVCPKCNKVLEGIFNHFEISKYQQKEDSRGKIKPPEKKCECGTEFKFEKEEIVINEFSRNGYILRVGEVVNKPGANYLYIKADKEFFERNEKSITDAGAQIVSSSEADEIIKKIEEAEESAASGMGAIFG